MKEILNKNKKIFALILSILFVLVLIYVGIYIISVVVVKEEYSIEDEHYTLDSNMFWIENEKIISGIWENDDKLTLLVEKSNLELVLINYDIQTRTKEIIKTYTRNISSSVIQEQEFSENQNPTEINLKLGNIANKEIICTWSHPIRNNETDIATVVEIRDLYSEELIKSIDFLRYVKVSVCSENLLLSNGNQLIEEFMLLYSISEDKFLDENISNYEISGLNTTVVTKNTDKIFELDLTNRYIEVIANQNENRFLLIDIEGNGLVYIKQ